MNYIFVALAVFWTIRLLQVWISTPTWMWQLSQLALAGLFALPWDSSWMDWYTPFAIAGMVALLQMIENLLIAKSDEALSTIMRRR
jgi:hypothetical protein